MLQPVGSSHSGRDVTSCGSDLPSYLGKMKDVFPRHRHRSHRRRQNLATAIDTLWYSIWLWAFPCHHRNRQLICTSTVNGDGDVLAHLYLNFFRAMTSRANQENQLCSPGPLQNRRGSKFTRHLAKPNLRPIFNLFSFKKPLTLNDAIRLYEALSSVFVRLVALWFFYLPQLLTIAVINPIILHTCDVILLQR